MQQFPHHYSIVAKADTQGDVVLAGERLPPIPSAPPTEFGGPGDRWSPETLLVAAVADCFVLARRLSWKEVAESFQTFWEKVCDSVEYVVQWGLAHRTLGPIFAIGVDEIQYAKGYKYLTLVYQIDDLTRLLWIGQERTVETFEGFFTMIGQEFASQIEFVCSDIGNRTSE